MVTFEDRDGERVVSVPCEDGGTHLIRVRGSKPVLVDEHDPDLLAVASGFGALPPPCHRAMEAAKPSWGTRQKHRFTKAEGWRRKVVVVAAFCAAGYDLCLPDGVDPVPGAGWFAYAHDLFWSGLTDEEIPVWVAAGFVVHPEILAWSLVGDPAICTAWKTAGYDADTATMAVRGGLRTPDDARRGEHEIGALCDGRVAAGQELGWFLSGVRSSQDLTCWFHAGITRGAEAAQWVAHGFGPVEAADWVTCGFSPGDAARWRDAGWSPTASAEAVAAGAIGVRHANDLRERGII